MPKTAAQDNNASKTTQRHSGPLEEADAGAIRILELPETPAMSVEMLRTRSDDWFQRMQKEAIGVLRRLEPQVEAERRRCD